MIKRGEEWSGLVKNYQDVLDWSRMIRNDQDWSEMIKTAQE